MRIRDLRHSWASVLTPQGCQENPVASADKAELRISTTGYTHLADTAERVNRIIVTALAASSHA